MSELSQLQEAIGLATTFGPPTMVMDADDPMGMMHEIAAFVGQRQLSEELAWGLIANAYGGDWTLASPEWREAAERWRDNYHASLRVLTSESIDPA